ncbi:hypothetical protein Ciccas_013781 [Cichlidogyrus casuarinus]|uniref:HYDIN/VesB/CFA65-like Ig-like domain-containing protein n=1 Tax=Cichlidogyrus casuarinus TaxID=1844966 RepID=A0ABD2PK90_9PLAT
MDLTLFCSVSICQNWDDSKYSIRWADFCECLPELKVQSGATRSSTPNVISTSSEAVDGSLQPAGIFRKKRIVEAEPEPEWEACKDANGTDISALKPIKLLVSAIIDYSRLQCETRWLNFRDTHILESRKQGIQIANRGIVSASYRLALKMNQKMPFRVADVLEPESSRTSSFSRPMTAGSSACRSPVLFDRPKTAKNDRPESPFIDFDALVPFTVTPSQGTILPGQVATIEIEFAPLATGMFDCRLVCEVDNSSKLVSLDQAPTGLNITPVTLTKTSGLSRTGSTEEQPTAASLKALESISMFQVRLTGSSKPSFLHLTGLQGSDYLNSGRRNLERPGPLGASPGLPLDPATKVVELYATGVGARTST